MDVCLSSPEQTAVFARHVAGLLQPGDCLALHGEMGAGKSSFARAVIRALAHDEALDVPSPTFALVQPYNTQLGLVFHYDLWRLASPDELYELSWDDACEGIMLVEWPDHAADLLPAGAFHLTFTPGEAEQERHVSVHGWPEERLEALAMMYEGEQE